MLSTAARLQPGLAGPAAPRLLHAALVVISPSSASHGARSTLSMAACSPSTSFGSPVIASRQQKEGRAQLRPRASATAAETATAAGLGGEVEVSKTLTSIIQYAFNFARVSETYESHSWMLVLGLLKHEDCRACKILKDAGLVDLYGAWNEALWALNISNGLKPRAFTSEIRFSDRALRILVGACNFAKWGGRTKVQSEDLLMALAAGNVLTGLYPDLGLTLERVRSSAAKHGVRYALPDDTPEKLAAVDAKKEDSFL
jgi:hypothetical protein